jgi:hypothetical protein
MTSKTLTTAVIEEILKDLPARLSAGSQVVPQYLDASLRRSVEGEADIIVLDAATDRLAIIEVKGTAPWDELPDGVLPAILQVQRVNARHKPAMILASVSHVSGSLRTALEQNGVTLLTWPREDFLSQLADAVTTPLMQPAAAPVAAVKVFDEHGKPLGEAEYILGLPSPLKATLMVPPSMVLVSGGRYRIEGVGVRSHVVVEHGQEGAFVIRFASKP